MVMKMAVFWVVTPCSLVALMKEAVCTCETSVNFYQLRGATTQKNAIFILVAVRT
jgi:hypothetical protein